SCGIFFIKLFMMSSYFFATIDFAFLHVVKGMRVRQKTALRAHPQIDCNTDNSILVFASGAPTPSIAYQESSATVSGKQLSLWLYLNPLYMVLVFINSSSLIRFNATVLTGSQLLDVFRPSYRMF